MEIIRNVAAGSVWFDLYWTADAGTHWRRVLRVGSPPYTGVPLGCDLCDGAISFSSPTTGWFTGCWCGVGSGRSFLYATHDSGRSWHVQRLISPLHLQRSTIATLPAIMFGRRAGILPTLILGLAPGRPQGAAAYFDAYVTEDGGEHWRATTPVRIEASPGYPDLLRSFPDPPHGFLVVGSKLYRTSDGGRHWQVLPLSLPLDRSTVIQFVDGEHGFMLHPGDTSGRRSLLWRTANGGRTWTKLHPSP